MQERRKADDAHREEQKKLQLCAVKQNGQILRELRAIRKDTAQHFRDDADFQVMVTKKHGTLESSHEKVATDMWWVKKSIIALFGLVGLGHMFK